MKEISDEKWLAAVGGGLLCGVERNGGVAYPLIESPQDYSPNFGSGHGAPQGQKPSLPKTTVTPWFSNLHRPFLG